jgi:hypothetical protein
MEIDSLYLIGDAAPGGWDLANQTAMAQTEDDSLVFTWSGTLTAGELKIR